MFGKQPEWCQRFFVRRKMAAVAGIPYVFLWALTCQMRSIVGIVHITAAAEEGCTVVKETQLFCDGPNKLFRCYWPRNNLWGDQRSTIGCSKNPTGVQMFAPVGASCRRSFKRNAISKHCATRPPRQMGHFNVKFSMMQCWHHQITFDRGVEFSDSQCIISTTMSSHKNEVLNESGDNAAVLHSPVMIKEKCSPANAMWKMQL